MSVDAIVIGAGVLGLASAARFASSGLSTLILEKAPFFGTGISSRNSEVIHAGIYYPRNSIKSIACLRGNRLMYKWCSDFNVSHKKVGKLIVAVNAAELDEILRLKNHAALCNVHDLRIISKRELTIMEPSVNGEGAIFSPSTGIIDSHELMTSMLAYAENFNCSLALNNNVKKIYYKGTKWNVDYESNGEIHSISSNILVNSCGLGALNLVPESIPLKMHPCRGRYFTLNKPLSHPLQHLVYPIPEKNIVGLGVHATIDLAGATRFGPDTQYINNADDYTFENPDNSIRKDFAISIKKYLPEVEEEHLEESYTGIRPKLNGPKDSPTDFTLLRSGEKCVHLLGIESPGLTSSIWLADKVANLVGVTNREGWWIENNELFL